MAHDEQLWRGIQMHQPDHAFKLSTDSMLVSSFASIPPRAKVADLGAGCGAIGLLLCADNPTCQITGIEIQEASCQLAKKNIADNQLSERFSIVHGDLRQIRTLLPANTFDCVVSNPPYFPVNAGASASQEAIAIARSEQCCTLQDLCQAAAWLLKYGGTFSFVHRPERLADLIWEMRLVKIEPKRIRFVHHHPGAAISLVLLEGKLGGSAGLKYEKDLVLFDSNGAESEEYKKIYHH